MRNLLNYKYLLLFFVSCTTNSNDKEHKYIDTTVNIKADNTSNEFQKDSLRNPSSYYYLTDYPLRKCGSLILTDSISPSDNEITFNCMDSISSKNKLTRDYFFPVFISIIHKSDGALSEAVGSYAMKYIETYPKEFVERSKSISELSFRKIAYFTAYEVGYEYESNPNKWTNIVLEKCKNCDSITLNKLTSFNEIVLKTVEEDKE